MERTSSQLHQDDECSSGRLREAEYREALSLIEPVEQARVSRFVFEKDRKLALIGRLLIRHAVCTVLRLRAKEMTIARSSENKPYVVLPSDVDARFRYWNFNVSHHGDWVVLAAEPHHLVGVDVTKVEIAGKDKSVGNFLSLMNNCFTAGEWKFIDQNPRNDQQRLERFFRLWALKEAYIKAIGNGLGFDLQRAEFIPAASGELSPAGEISTKLAVDRKSVSGWRFEEWHLDTLHPVAVAVGPLEDAVPSFKAVLPKNATSFSVAPVHEHPIRKFRVLSVQELVNSQN